MNIETTYDVVVLAESALYLMLAVLAVALTLYTLCGAWLKAAQARAQVQFNQIEWEQQRQLVIQMDDDIKQAEVHQDTAEFYLLDDE